MEQNIERPVSDAAYVVVEHPESKQRTSMQVPLMSGQKLTELARRRESILRGEIGPSESTTAGLCRKCPYLRECNPRILARVLLPMARLLPRSRSKA